MAKRMTKKERERVGRIMQLLDNEYGTEHRCYLNHDSAWQLLIATILSAQCTDARVNIVTIAKQEELEKDIRSIGFYRNKAKNIIACTKRLITEFNSEVPESMYDLVSLSGVGRKTANVIRGNVFNKPSIVVDTHVKRISKKLGFTKEEDPEKIEYELMKVLPKDHWILYNIHIITLGRSICTARSPQCEMCFLKYECPSSGFYKKPV